MPTAADTRALRVLLVNDCPEKAQAIATELERAGYVTDSRTASTAETLREVLTGFSPDVVLASHSLERLDTFETLKALTAARPGCPVIVLADDIDAHTAVDVLRAGAEDIVRLDRIERLQPAVESAVGVRQRLKALSPRQLEVLSLVAQGNTSPEIAVRLNISVKTVETHRGELMKRIGARDVVGLVHYALRVGLVSNAA